MEGPQVKKSRLSGQGSGRNFQVSWTEKYGVIDRNGHSLCLFCHETVVSRTWNVKRHFETKHRWLLEKSEEERKEHVSEQLQRHECQSDSVLKVLYDPTNVISASFSIDHSIAQHGKALGDGEFIKETFLKCAPFLFQDMHNKDAIIKRISDLAVSRNTSKDKVMTCDVQNQLKGDLNNCKYFSICLDKTTDVTSSARLAVIARFSDGQTMREELVKLETLPGSTAGGELCNIVLEMLRDLNIDTSKIVSVTTDGASIMVDKEVGLVKLFMEAIGHAVVPFHCIIDQEGLCAKAGWTELHDVITVVTEIVNLIAAGPHHNAEFSALLREVESTYNRQAMHKNVRWLSPGQILEKCVDCFEEMKFYAEKNNLVKFPQLNDCTWVSSLMFFTDLSVHMNELNLKLQGFGKSIDVMFGYIKAFETKLQIFKRDVGTKTYKYFPRLKKYLEVNSDVHNESEPWHLKYHAILNSIIDQFGGRFKKFRSLEQTIKIIKFPDVVVYKSMELSDFQWLQMEELELQLAEFQASIWTQVFVDLRSQLENLERNRLQNEECYYEQEILTAWNRIPETFSTLKNLAMALLTIFTSTHFCETLFLALNNIKTDKRKLIDR